MHYLPCPWCGPREETEFLYGAPADLRRPALDAEEATWAEYLFCRDSPRGAHRERWLHRHGCGQWFVLVRDTVSHAVTGSCSLSQDATVAAPGALREGAPA